MDSALFSNWILRWRINCMLFATKRFENKLNRGACEISKSTNNARRFCNCVLQTFPVRENKFSTSYTEWYRLKLMK